MLRQLAGIVASPEAAQVLAGRACRHLVVVGGCLDLADSVLGMTGHSRNWARSISGYCLKIRQVARARYTVCPHCALHNKAQRVSNSTGQLRLGLHDVAHAGSNQPQEPSLKKGNDVTRT
jgi:hypothetical protein